MKEQKNVKKSCIPTIEELQRLYRDDLRREALKASEYENSKKAYEQGAFFKAFRKYEESSKILPKLNNANNSNNENDYYEKYRAYVEEETANQGKKIEEIENSMEYERFFLQWERRVNSESNNFSHYRSNSATRYRIDRIEKLKKELEIILESSPEAWEFYYKRQLIRDIEAQHQQRLVSVPYVAEAKQKVIDSLNLGVPVYIVGHLGSGKTQLAAEAALEFTVQNKIQCYLEEKMEEWFSDNPDAKEEDAIVKFGKLYKERKLFYKNMLNEGSKEEIESLQPLFISGSHNLTYEDMFAEKTLSLERSFSQGSYADYLNMIIGDFYEWMDEHKERLEQMTNEEQLQLKIQIWKSFSDLLVASNSSFGTIIKKTEREILIAVKEGRPVIVDELNAIAMQNLIALNDILQRHAGSTAYITGVGPVMIKPGFGFIGTGNLSTQMVNYEGTNELNPAFKSRFVTIEYNYVPQKITGSLEEQEFLAKNELFRIIIAQLADKNGNIQIPDCKRTLEELFRFSQLCRITQNVFMGKWKESDAQKDFGTDEPGLRESVLSIRNILHILDNWNLGEEKDLSKAIWDGFISSITYPDDQNYILSQAVRFGFFTEGEGWRIQTKGIGEASTTYEEARTRSYQYVRPPIETLSSLDVVNIVFGKGIPRKTVPKALKEIFEADIDDSLRLDANKYQILDRHLSHLEHTKDILEYLEENGGEK